MVTVVRVVAPAQMGIGEALRRVYPPVRDMRTVAMERIVVRLK